MRKAMRRSNVGSTTVEGAVGILIITIVFCAGTALLVSVGSLIYYKVKIGFALQTAIRQVVQLDAGDWLGAYSNSFTGTTLVAATPDIVKNTFRSMSLPVPNDSDIAVSMKYVNYKTYIHCSVTVDSLRLFGGKYLPKFMSLSDSTCAVVPNTTPIAMFGLTYNSPGTCRGIYIPSYGAASNTSGPTSFPLGKFPYWQIVAPAGAWGGEYQNWDGGGPYSYSSY